MQIDVGSAALVGREMNWWERLLSRTGGVLVRVRRRLPHLVWHGDEIDVRVTLKDLGALHGAGTSLDRVFEVQRLLSEMGITFDSGSGPHGRDWEWDFSLSGPISVQFDRSAARPERRTARHKPRLIINNTDPTPTDDEV